MVIHWSKVKKSLVLVTPKKPQTNVVPYLLEDQLIAVGGVYRKVEDWNSLAVVDGLIITRQNPGSSAAVAEALVKALN